MIFCSIPQKMDATSPLRLSAVYPLSCQWLMHHDQLCQTVQQQMKTLSRHSDTAKAFAYLLKQWDALNVYCSNGWVEIDNNIAENALRGVAVGRKNWMFAGSDSGGEHAAVLYSLIGTCRLNNVEPEKWLRYVIEHIQDWPANRVRDLLPWKVDLSSQ